MQKEDILSIIPKPKNEDVIVYDLSLSSLIDKDVFFEYNNALNIYKIKKETYLNLDAEIKEYEKIINDVYLYNKSWNEQDYIRMIQDAKKSYSILYGDIKKTENNIEILNKKYSSINEKIEIQIKKEKNEVEIKKKTIDKDIEQEKNKILVYKSKISEAQLDRKRLEEQVTDLQDEIKLCMSMQKELDTDTYTCKYCGTTIKNKNSKTRVFNVLEKNINKISKRLDSYMKSFEKVETNIAYYENELRKSKANLNNSIQLKKQDNTSYLKKSIKILELEAARDEILNKIDVLKKEYNSNKNTKSPKFLELKDLISKYELSLQNLEKLKEAKTNFKDKYTELQNLKKELLDLYDNLTLYKKFIEIFYKIYQQKANDYFGNNIKFKFYKFNNIELQEIFEVYYNDVEYTQLSKPIKKEFDDIYMEKLSYFL